MRKGQKRPATSYLSSARNLSQWAPSLKRYAKRKTLTPAEKAAITRKENILKHYNLASFKPLTSAQARIAKRQGLLEEKQGVRGIYLRNSAPGAKVTISKGKISVRSNGHTIRYVRVSPPDPVDIVQAADEAFSHKGKITVWLWTRSGRASAGFRSLRQFAAHVMAAFAAYKDTDEWINGVAWLEE